MPDLNPLDGLQRLGGWVADQTPPQVRAIIAPVTLIPPVVASQQNKTLTSDATGVKTVGSPFGGFTSWLPYFLLLTGVLVVTQSSDKYAGLGTAFAAVIVGGYALTHYNGISTGFNDTFGTALPGAA